jgi:hypothetical protein
LPDVGTLRTQVEQPLQLSRPPDPIRTQVEVHRFSTVLPSGTRHTSIVGQLPSGEPLLTTPSSSSSTTPSQDGAPELGNHPGVHCVDGNDGERTSDGLQSVSRRPICRYNRIGRRPDGIGF